MFPRSRYSCASSGMRTIGFRSLLVWWASTLIVFGQPPKPRPNSPIDVDAWLKAHPNVAAAIVWQGPNETKAYPQWNEANKKRLAEAVTDAIAGKPTGLPSVPPNPYELKETDIPKQGLLPNDAYHLFLRYVANSLALELTHGVPWSIAHDTKANLAVLLDSNQMFVLTKTSGKPLYAINFPLCGSSLPAPPDLTLGFLRGHDLIGTSRLDTIVRTLEWCKGMTHFIGALDLVRNMTDTWHNPGMPPAIRIMEGTTMSAGNPSGHINGLRHFTAGCHGTTGFLRSVLRAVKIPVVNYRAAGHSLPYFSSEGKYLTHGDDPYTRLFSTLYPPLPASELLIDQARFVLLFGPAVAPGDVAKNVGSRACELAERYLPIILLSNYAKDLAAKKSHANGRVYESLKNAFTLEQLEEDRLWPRMDARIAELGGVAKVAELEATLTKHKVAEEN